VAEERNQIKTICLVLCLTFIRLFIINKKLECFLSFLSKKKKKPVQSVQIKSSKTTIQQVDVGGNTTVAHQLHRV
jgi:hypothetical protein